MQDKRKLLYIDLEMLRLFAVMLGSGISALDAIGFIAMGEKNERKRTTLQHMAIGISEGRRFSEIFSKTALSKNLVYMHILQAAEDRGGIPDALHVIVEEMTESRKRANQLLSILMYPVIVVIMALVLVLMLMCFIVPNIAPIVKSSAADLPLVTRVLFSSSEVMRKDGLKIFLIALVAIGIVAYLVSTAAIRVVLEKTILRTPLLGDFTVAYASSAYTRAISRFLEHKSDVAEVFSHLGRISSLKIFRSEFLKVAEGVSRGRQLSDALGDLSHTPHMWSLFARVAEQGSSYSAMFEALHGHYKHAFERLSQTVMRSIEPVMMICIGVIVGLLAYAILSPLYGMMNHMNG